MQYDVFNGDADGICSLHQLRLANPKNNVKLISGIKRDINLLRKIRDAENSSITVLDVSLDKNRNDLNNLLTRNNSIFYVDHHYAGEIPSSPLLDHHIEPSAETCTSLIVHEFLGGKFGTWAICGAFGDNMNEQALQLAETLELSDREIETLKEIGELFNYNGYGSTIEDLHFHPASLYEAIQPFEDPFTFSKATDLVFKLKNGYQKDMAKALEQKEISPSGGNRIYSFPAAPWARRIVGVFSNLKAREKKKAAHAIIVENDDATLQISVRAPLNARVNADTLCRKFPTGGGRAAAAGINHLPPEMREDFISEFHAMYSEPINESSK